VSTLFTEKLALVLLNFSLARFSGTEPIIILLIILNVVVLTSQAARNVYNFPRPSSGYFFTWEDYVLFVLFLLFTCVFPICASHGEGDSWLMLPNTSVSNSSPALSFLAYSLTLARLAPNPLLTRDSGSLNGLKESKIGLLG
jgi:hypothetical protein